MVSHHSGVHYGQTVHFNTEFKFPDEEDVEEETRKHKNLYFGHQSNASQPTKEEAVRDVASNVEDIDMSDDETPIAPANFLFSNDIDSDEPDRDDETMDWFVHYTVPNKIVIEFQMLRIIPGWPVLCVVFIRT